jgi:hypothetical protein
LVDEIDGDDDGENDEGDGSGGDQDELLGGARLIAFFDAWAGAAGSGQEVAGCVAGAGALGFLEGFVDETHRVGALRRSGSSYRAPRDGRPSS